LPSEEEEEERMARTINSWAQSPDDQGYDVEATLRLTGVSSACLVRYEQARIVVPLRVGRRRQYKADDLKRIRKANRLERDLGINLAGIEVVLRLTQQIADLQRRMAGYEAEGRGSETGGHRQ
jgi:MerR family transcriptional regulator, heat shock protein HspR